MKRLILVLLMVLGLACGPELSHNLIPNRMINAAMNMDWLVHCGEYYGSPAFYAFLVSDSRTGNCYRVHALLAECYGYDVYSANNDRCYTVLFTQPTSCNKEDHPSMCKGG